MGNDGGSIPDRRDLVKTKVKAEQADKANQTSQLTGDGEEICGHIRSLKDIKTLKLTARPTPPTSADVPPSEVPQFVCPLNFKEMNGVQPFVSLRSCGCVLSQSALRELLFPNPPTREISNSEESNGDSADKEQLDVCPQCATKFSQKSDIQMINPSEEEEQRMRAAMDIRRSREPAKPKMKKRKVATDTVVDEATASKRKKSSPAGNSPSPAPSLNPTISTASRALTHSLVAEGVKRKANMSDAVKSLYRGKGDPPRKETFTTMGTFTRYA
ncbi:DUF602-domain-containing protein [Boletus reticuloceps]|uniref:DUF602-domain-containing protein n=1 Tax=Boletus reticuloceps TaxID=495285 RepID=A0A8I2YJV7_9AGAM|nr:DUF602-domain-containing protein [Boletus reticuloceps]